MRLKLSAPSLLPGLIEDLDICMIKQPKRLLRRPNNIEELADSIRKKGLLQPIIVRTRPDNQEISFEIVAGTRRYLACKSLGRKKITCHVVELDDREAFEISLVENVQRHTFSPIEEAQAFKTYITDYGWGGVSELAKVIGKSQEYVSKRIKLLELPEEMQNEIIRHRIKPSIGEELAYIKNKETQSKLAKMISERHVTVKQLRHEIVSAASQELIVDNNAMDFQEAYRRAVTAYDKVIIALKLTLRRINDIIESIEEADWLINGSLLQQKSIISSQIDSLLKEKRKYLKLVCTRRSLLVC